MSREVRKTVCPHDRLDTVHTNLHTLHFVKRARRRGARLVVIDPYRNRTALLADLHLAPADAAHEAQSTGQRRGHRETESGGRP